MTTLPTFSSARVVAHTTDDTTRRVFENDDTNFRSWRDMDSSQDSPYLWRASSELLDPVLVPRNPETDEYLRHVPADATIPAGATHYRTAPSGNFYGPFERDEPYTPTRRNARNTYWTVEPGPEPEPDPEPEAGPSWWADLNEAERTRIEWLSSDQAKMIAYLIPYKPGESTLVGDEGILPVLNKLSSIHAIGRRYGLVLALDAFLGGEL